MKTIVVDDEPWMLKRFAIECEGLSDVQLLGSFNSPQKAIAFARENQVELAFLDVEMPGMNGIELAGKLKEIYAEMIIIFISAYENYMPEAFKTKTADYYIVKPYNTADIEAAMERARLLSGRFHKTIFARTFGTFELFADRNPVSFRDSKAKELLALLISYRGGILSEEEASRALWPHMTSADSKTVFQSTEKYLHETLRALHCGDIVEQNDAGAFIHTDALDCDLYQFLDGDPKAARQYGGRYMDGYDWAKDVRKKIFQQSEQLGLYYDAQARNALIASIRTLCDPRLTIRYMNDGFFALVGYSRSEIENRFQNSFRAMIWRDDFEQADTDVKRSFKEGKLAETQFRLVEKNNRELWVICKSEPPVPVSDDKSEVSSILIDITETKAKEHVLEQAASLDGLTGLLNRGFAQASIQHYLTAEEAAPVSAFILMDVDNFKAVNDTYGHPFADTVLTDIAAIFTRSFRSNDIVCRFGGDEMLVFLKGIGSEATARTKLNHTAEALHVRLAAKTKRGEISCSFGAAMCPQNGGDFETLYQNADHALYMAKKKKNCIVWFDDVP